MSGPTISVVIPTKNRSAYVAEAIASVLAQTHPVDEVIVVDDGSTDDTPAVLAGFGDAIRIVRQEGRGDGAARNRGVTVSSGTLIAFLDDDDLWEPHKTEVQLAAFGRAPQPDAVFGHAIQFASPELGPGRVPVPLDADEPIPGHFAGTLLVRRSTFDAIGPIAEIGGGGDFFDWYARLIDSPFRVTTVPEVVLRRRLHLSNLGRQNDPAQRYARVLRRVVDRRRGRVPTGTDL